MIPILIDISSTVEAFSFSKDQIDSFTNLLLSNITSSYMQQWEKLVDDNLKGTKLAYKSGMKFYYPDAKSVVFALEGKGESKLGLMIENGASAFDQKEGFEKSSKKKQKKNGGWYLTIPMRLATSESIGESSIFSGKMDKTLQKLVKKEGVLTAKNVPKELQMKGVRSEITTPTKTYPEYKHKSFEFEGLRRQKDSSGRGKYQLFRRISDNSDDNAWIHPGFQPRKFMERAIQDIQVDKIYDHTRDQFLSEIK